MLTLLLFLTSAPAADDGPGPATSETALKWVRDSAEYYALTTSAYRQAAAALAANKKGKGPWAAVLDVDETVLDNSVYQLERHAYDLPYNSPSWHAWCERAQAVPVPGVTTFVAEVRRQGGRVVYLTNRKAVVADATRENLEAVGLWQEGDLLCPRVDVSDKGPRREQLRTGEGACSFDRPTRAAVYLGDSYGDFPADGEEAQDRLAGMGVRYFILPNPLYGDWQFLDGITRPLP
ncbi:MAG: 5'-nucleotidase (lipoprotein e(P4) family) [Myxococcota bacterium]|jgi:5'-nucleotidase (lipoprotein e(P4) family)